MLAGISDWETGVRRIGSTPRYLWQANPGNYFWREEIEHFLDPVAQEVEMEKIRLK